MHTIECKGAPRGLGLDQGAACAPAIRSWLDERGIAARRRWFPDMRRLTSGGALGGGVGREVLRHYPHLAERMSGIARSSGVSLDALMEDVVASAYGVAGNALSQASIAVAASSTGEAQLARELDSALPWALRRSFPEVGFASVELTLPWLAGALVGVNEMGLGAAVATPAEAARFSGVHAAPAWMLIQECLQRFDEIDGAIEWCLKRPAGGSFSLLLGDSTGDRALVEISGDEAKLIQRGGEFALDGGAPAEQTAVRKRLELRADCAGAFEAARVLVSLSERRVSARVGDVEESLSLS